MTSAPIPSRVHLVGIGGMHMSAIGRILLSWGHQVSGSDLRRSPLTDTLAALGATVAIGPHDAANVGDAGLVVTTSAAISDNPELDEARRRGIPVVKRADMVARLMEGKTGICVAGCHGKSTTSGLIAFILKDAGRDPTYLIGAEVSGLGTNAAPGSGAEVVVEADEYDRAFLSYHPHIALVLNVEADHLDYYKTWDAYRDAFRQFASQVEPGGTLVLCTDNAEALALREYAAPGVEIVTYGLDSQSDWDAWSLESEGPFQTFTAVYKGQLYGRFALSLPGRHNVQNALGAIAVCHALGLKPDAIADAIERYAGVRRRFERIGEAAGVIVMDDYSHHPTEIAALAKSARQRFPDRRVVVLFQPHTYARTRYLLDGFRTCFQGFDRLFLLETYAAREPLAGGMTAQQLSTEITSPIPTYIDTPEAAADAIAGEVRAGDVFFTAGAGDVDAVGPLLLERLRAREAL
ncbi:MAG: UDP-N-acetylmuramate--L-alanine ligase [Dehalococcoidia bacterium]|nr:UDP-N-acetylmuramate--L-alanine ligase [Dehalococcoidia bacterium]